VDLEEATGAEETGEEDLEEGLEAEETVAEKEEAGTAEEDLEAGLEAEETEEAGLEAGLEAEETEEEGLEAEGLEAVLWQHLACIVKLDFQTPASWSPTASIQTHTLVSTEASSCPCYLSEERLSSKESSTHCHLSKQQTKRFRTMKDSNSIYETFQSVRQSNQCQRFRGSCCSIVHQ
jgi:hypothetical protein